ncbi:unnamed protein product, partial [Effrenium voratum]
MKGGCGDAGRRGGPAASAEQHKLLVTADLEVNPHEGFQEKVEAVQSWAASACFATDCGSGYEPPEHLRMGIFHSEEVEDRKLLSLAQHYNEARLAGAERAWSKCRPRNNWEPTEAEIAETAAFESEEEFEDPYYRALAEQTTEMEDPYDKAMREQRKALVDYSNISKLKFKVLVKSGERCLSFSLGPLLFLDSTNFVQGSLDGLIETRKKKAKAPLDEVFPMLARWHPQLQGLEGARKQDVWGALLKKLPVPFARFRGPSAWQKPAVWQREDYDSSLKNERCSKETYKSVQETVELM